MVSKGGSQCTLGGFFDFVAHLDISWSITSYVFTNNGSLVRKKFNIQLIVALLTMEAKYMTMNEVAKEGI